MKRRQLLKGVGAAALLPTALSHATQGKKTNVILIMTDDTGYEVFGCYGSQQYKTPRVDRLAETGMRFNHCYSNPVCAPSRVKIMTGKSNVRNYVHWGILDPGEKTLGTHDERRRLCHVRRRKVPARRRRNFRA